MAEITAVTTVVKPFRVGPKTATLQAAVYSVAASAAAQGDEWFDTDFSYVLAAFPVTLGAASSAAHDVIVTPRVQGSDTGGTGDASAVGFETATAGTPTIAFLVLGVGATLEEDLD